MKIKKLYIVLIVISLLHLSCGKDGSGILDIFIPNLSNQWQSSRGTSFFFNPTNEDVNESEFLGSEQNPDNGDNFQLTGKFKNYDIDFTFTEGPEKDIKYAGKFIKNSNPLRMEVHGTNGKTLVITQNLQQ